MFPGANIVDWIYGDYRDDSAEVIEAQRIVIKDLTTEKDALLKQFEAKMDDIDKKMDNIDKKMDKMIELLIHFSNTNNSDKKN